MWHLGRNLSLSGNDVHEIHCIYFCNWIACSLTSCSVATTTLAYISVLIALGPHPLFFKFLNAISGLLDGGGGGGGSYSGGVCVFNVPVNPSYSESFQIHLGRKWDIKKKPSKEITISQNFKDSSHI